MAAADYRSVVNDMHLANGAPWSMAITLAVFDEDAKAIKEGEEIALADDAGKLHAVMQVQEKFGYEKKVEAAKAYGTDDEKHPGVGALYSEGDTLLGGPVQV